MERLPRRISTYQFKMEVVRLIELGQSVAEASQLLGVVEQKLSTTTGLSPQPLRIWGMHSEGKVRQALDAYFLIHVSLQSGCFRLKPPGTPPPAASTLCGPRANSEPARTPISNSSMARFPVPWENTH